MKYIKQTLLNMFYEKIFNIFSLNTLLLIICWAMMFGLIFFIVKYPMENI